MNTRFTETHPHTAAAKAWKAQLARPLLSEAPLFVPGHQRQARILYVEGDPQLRTLGKLVLLRAGYDVHAASHGAAAWVALNQEPYDLLITEHELPRMTGLELAASVRHAEMNLSIVITAAFFDPTWRASWAQLKITMYLAKPYAVDSLLSAVKETIVSGGRVRPVDEDAPGPGSILHQLSHVRPHRHGGIND